MEVKISEVQPAAAQAWGLPDSKKRETEAIPPVAKTEGGGAQGVSEDNGREYTPKSNLDPQKVDEMTKEVQSYLDDLNISLNFKFEDKSGGLVVQVMNKDTGDVIRQIPPESLVRLREKLRELRGSLVDDKV